MIPNRLKESWIILLGGMIYFGSGAAFAGVDDQRSIPRPWALLRLDIAVTNAANSRAYLPSLIGEISGAYDFHPDSSFQPQEVNIETRRPNARIYRIRGWVPLDRVPDLQRASCCHGLNWDDEEIVWRILEPLSIDETKFFNQYAAALYGIKGVNGVFLQEHCSDELGHRHIVGHESSIVISLDGSVPKEDVAKALSEIIRENPRLPLCIEVHRSITLTLPAS